MPIFSTLAHYFAARTICNNLCESNTCRRFPALCRSFNQNRSWFFVLDHTHYARWILVHLVSQKEVNPNIHAEFVKGNFAIRKSRGVFSAIAIDQAHEQNNASVRGDGGAVGLTENTADLH